MRIIIKNKKNTQKKAGEMRFTRLNDSIYLNISYQGNHNFIIDLQKLLLKYYNLKLIAGEGKVTNKLLLPEIKETQRTKVAHKRMKNKIQIKSKN